MKVAVLAAFVREPREILLVADRTNAKFNELPWVDWTFTALIAGSEEDFAKAAEIAGSRPRIGAAFYPDQQTLWREAIHAAPADADIIVTLDGATDWPEEIPWLLDALEPASVGLAVGVRRFPPAPPEGIQGKLVQLMTGGAVADLTSCFRAWRTSAVRGRTLGDTPDELMPALAAAVVDEGLRIVEVPVTTAAPAPTLPPKLGTTLLKRRFGDRITWGAALIVLLGLGVFLISSFPVHQYLADSDAVLTGICAADVLEGRHYLFFPSGYRIGSLTCYADAGFVALLGRTREALAAVAMLYAVLNLTFVYVALRLALGRIPAVVGMLAAAFPPMQYVLVTEWTYGEVMAATSAVWCFGFLLLFRPAFVTGITTALYGLALGLAFWVSPQSLMLTGPLTAFLFWRKSFTGLARSLQVAGGVVLGLWAYVATILQKGTEPFTTSFATKPVDSLGQLSANLSYLFSAVLPTFFFDSEWPLQTPLQGCLFLLVLTGFISTGLVAYRWWRNQGARRTGDDRNGLIAVFTLALIVSTCVLFAVSSAGNFRGWMPRYIVPVFFALPLIVANLYAIARRHSSGVAVLACVIAFAGLNLSTYRYTSDPTRRSQTAALELNHQIHAWLRAMNRDVVLGDYWLVYKWNFGFGTGIDAIPVPTALDYAQLHRRLPPARPVHLALTHLDEGALTAWAARTGLTGHLEK